MPFFNLISHSLSGRSETVETNSRQRFFLALPKKCYFKTFFIERVLELKTYVSLFDSFAYFHAKKSVI